MSQFYSSLSASQWSDFWSSRKRWKKKKKEPSRTSAIVALSLALSSRNLIKHSRTRCTHTTQQAIQKLMDIFVRLHGSHSARPMERERRLISIVYIAPLIHLRLRGSLEDLRSLSLSLFLISLSSSQFYLTPSTTVKLTKFFILSHILACMVSYNIEQLSSPTGYERDRPSDLLIPFDDR